MISKTMFGLALVLAISPVFAQTGGPAAQGTTTGAKVLSSAEAGAVMPATVFFRGKSAAIQARNSSGLEVAKGQYVLAALVDTSGYSSSVQERYQAYLITEVPLSVDGHRLAPGAYGCGFIPGDQFVVQDLGGNDVFVAHAGRDASLKRPTPLQMMAAQGQDGVYRLLAGRTFVEFRVETSGKP